MNLYCSYSDTENEHIKQCDRCGRRFNTLVMALTKTLCCKTPVTVKPNSNYVIAPTKGSCFGVNVKKPHDYNVTAVIPHLETPEPLAVAVELLQLQTEKPYILIIDTGSTAPETLNTLENLRQANVEIHYIRAHGWQHPSQPVAVAQDLAMALCRTRFLFNTHADCFLKRRELLSEWMQLAVEHRVVGYQISPRPYKGWENEFGHTALMIDHAYCLRHNISWNMTKYAADRQRVLTPDMFGPNCPDTESEFNAALSRYDIKGLFIGDGEENHQRNNNDDFDHPRSYCCSSLYSPSYHKMISTEMTNAIADAKERIQLWRKS